MALKNLSRAFTLTEGAPGVYVLSGGPTTSRRISEAFADGETHSFYITNNIAFELINGEYSASSNSIVVLAVIESSNNDLPVVWPPGQKLVVATATAEDLANMDNMVESENALIMRPEERQELRIKSDPFFWKSRATPLFGMGTGQSNIEPGFEVTPGSGYLHHRNNNVLCWSTDGSLTGPTVGVRAWRVADPTAPINADFIFQSTNPAGTFGAATVTTAGTFAAGASNYHINGRGPAPYSGYPGGQRGLATLGAAQQLQEERGAKAYFSNFAWSGQDSSQWKPGVGGVANLIDAQMPVMIAALRILEPTHFGGSAPIPWDFMIISQGSSDTNITQPEQWASNWEEYLDYASTFTYGPGFEYVNTKWFDRRHTLISIMQRAVRSTFRPWWNGQEILQQRRKNIRIISTAGRGVNPFDRIHFYGEQATEFGRDIARDWWNNGHAPVDNRLDLLKQRDATKACLGRFNFNGSHPNTTFAATDPGQGNWRFMGFSEGFNISRVDNDGNFVDFSNTVGAEIVFTKPSDETIFVRTVVTSVTEYDTHWSLGVRNAFEPAFYIASVPPPTFTVGFKHDLYLSGVPELSRVVGTLKFGVAQSAAPGAVAAPAVGTFDINGSHAGFLMSAVGCDGTPIETGLFAPGNIIQLIKSDDPFKRYRLTVVNGNAAPYGLKDSGAWQHVNVSLASQTAGFALTAGAEYIMTSTTLARMRAVAELADPLKQINAGLEHKNLPPSPLSAKVFDVSGLAMYAESRASGRGRIKFAMFLSDLLKKATLVFSHSLEILVKGARASIRVVDQTTGTVQDGIVITARGNAPPTVGLGGDVEALSQGTVRLFREKKALATAAPNAVEYGGQAAHDDATPGNRNGGPATLRGGDGAANQNGNGGDAILQPGNGAGTGIPGRSLINRAIYGGIFCAFNTTPEATVSASQIPITVCWNANMPSNDVVPTEANGKLTAPTAGMYELEGLITFTGTVNKIFFFGIESTAYAARQHMGGDGAPRNVKVKGFKAMAVNEEARLTVQSIDGGTSVVISEAQFTMRRISN